MCCYFLGEAYKGVRSVEMVICIVCLPLLLALLLPSAVTHVIFICRCPRHPTGLWSPHHVLNKAFDSCWLKIAAVRMSRIGPRSLCMSSCSCPCCETMVAVMMLRNELGRAILSMHVRYRWLYGRHFLNAAALARQSYSRRTRYMD